MYLQFNLVKPKIDRYDCQCDKKRYLWRIAYTDAITQNCVGLGRCIVTYNIGFVKNIGEHFLVLPIKKGLKQCW